MNTNSVNSVNYIVLNPYLKEMNDFSIFEEVFELHYILNNQPFKIIVGIYAREKVAPWGTCLSLKEIIEEQSRLNSNAEFVREYRLK